MNKHNCEICGCPVNVVGKTTLVTTEMHYEIDWDRVLENVTIDEKKMKEIMQNSPHSPERGWSWSVSSPSGKPDELIKALSSADILKIKE